MRRESPNFRPEKARWTVAIRTCDLDSLAGEWFENTLGADQSARTAELRRMQIARLGWFLQLAGHERCGASELKHFFRHLREGHTMEQGRRGR
jgi:hypothetical protein